MKLGFDIDEIICNLTDLLSAYVKDTYDVDWCTEDFQTYSILENSYGTDERISEEIGKDLIEKVNDPYFQLKAEPYKDAVVSIRKYKKQGHTIHLISSRPGDKTITAKWLRKHKIPFDTIHNLGHSKEKGKTGRMLNLDFYIDDLEKHLESMWKYKKRWRKGLILFDRPWNQKPHDASKFKRMYNWKEIDRHLGVQNR